MKKGVTDRFQSCGEIESTHEFEFYGGIHYEKNSNRSPLSCDCTSFRWMWKSRYIKSEN